MNETKTIRRSRRFKRTENVAPAQLETRLAAIKQRIEAPGFDLEKAFEEAMKRLLAKEFNA